MKNKTTKTAIKKTIKQFIKFGIVGVFNTCNSLIIYYILLFFKLHYLLANIIAYFTSTFISYFLNKKWVFNHKKENNRVLQYYIVYITSFFLNNLTLYFLVDILKLSDKIAPLFVLIVTVPYNYLLTKFWVFKEIKINKNDISHTFVICAYKESKHLESCIKSLKNQTLKTNIIMTTSTPNKYIKDLSNKYNIKLHIKKTKSDICDDWNFGYNLATTDLVTIAHQDDVYEKDYAENIVYNYQKYKDAVILYTDYYALKNNVKTKDKNSKIKKIIKLPLKSRFLAKFRLIKVLSLAFGNSINCPSVTYNKKKIGNNVFTSDLKFSLDWDTFLKLARTKGRFVYISKSLISYRIYDGATTMEFIENNKRVTEDTIMFNKIWPKSITKFIMKFYIKAYDTYKEE